MANRDELKKALDYLRRKDPENEVLQSYDRRFGNLTTSSEKTTYGSVSHYDHWKQNYSREGIKEKQRKSKKSITDLDGTVKSKGYDKEMEKRKKNPQDYVNQDAVDRVERQKELENKRMKQTQQKEKRENYLAERKKKSSSFLDDILTPLKNFGQAVNPFDDVSFRDAMKNNVEDALATDRSKVTQELNRAGARVSSGGTFGALDNVYEKTRGERSGYFDERDGAGKAADILYELAGFGISGGAVAKGISAAGLGARGATQSLGQRALIRGAEGALGGGIASGIEIGIQEGLNGHRADWKQNASKLALETGLGAAGDAGLGAIGDLIRLRKAKGATPKQVAKETGLPEEVVEREFIRGTNPGQELVDIVPPSNRLDAPKQPYQKWVDGPTTEPKSSEPLGLNEPLYRHSVDGLGKEVKINGTPQLNAPRFDRAVQSSELPDIESSLNSIFKRRQEEEDLFVRSEMAPYDDMLKRSAEADMAWNDSVKKSKEIAENIKKNYGKISIPEGNWADWGKEVPAQFRANRGTNTSGIDIYTFADNEGFSSVDEAVQFLKNIDAESKTKLKDLKPADDMKIKPEDYDALEQAARLKFQQTDTAKGLDGTFEELNSMLKSGNETAATGDPLSFMQSKMFKTKKEPISFTGRMNPKDTSAVRSEGSYSTRYKETPTGDTLEINPEKPIEFKTTQETTRTRKPIEETGRGNYRPTQETIVEPKTPVDEVEPPKKEFKLRSNLQFFNQAEMNSMVSTSKKRETVSVIDHVKNSTMRKIHKFYEGYVSRTHSAKLLDKEYGTELDKTLQNEAASGSMAKNFLDRHFSSLQKSLGKKSTDKDLADALEYQMAKNLLFNKSKNPDYELPKGWDWERLANVEGAGSGKYDEFTNSFRSLTQEWRDTMLEYGMIDKAAYDALGENPFYIPMYRDLEFKKDNIDLGARPGKRQGKRGADPLILHDWDAGDLNTFYANPLETVITNTFKLYSNALKNDTGLQFKKIAELDDGMFVKKISEKEYHDGGGVEVFVNGAKEYYRPQADMRDLMDELDSGLEMDALSKATSIYAWLKTSSLEYQAGAIPRDLAQSFITSQAGPIQWLKHAYTAAKNGSKNAKKVGATFHQAYSDHVGGIDPNKVTQEYAKQNAHVNNIDLKNKEGLKTLGNVLLKTIKLPFKPAQMLGQWTDNLPREIEVLEAQRRFQKKHGAEIGEIESRIAEIDSRIASAQGAPDFDHSTQGIESLAMEKEGLENQLMEFKRNLRREEIYRARDVINYSRMGRGKLAKKIRQYVIFANTTTQSKDKIVRSFIENPGKTLAKAGIVTAPFVAAQKIMMDNMSNEDRKLYDETPDYIKNFNYVFVLDGSVYTVPKVHELALITNPMEQAMAGESLSSSVQNAVKELVPYQIGNIAQGLVPKDGKVDVTDNLQLPGLVGMPIFDTIVNRKTGFNQKPISYGDLSKDKEGIKANKWTNEALKIIAGNNPKADYSEYLIRQYGGDVGKYGLAGLDFAFSSKNDRTDRLLEQINPIQDRVYRKDSKLLKDPIRVEKK